MCETLEKEQEEQCSAHHVEFANPEHIQIGFGPLRAHASTREADRLLVLVYQSVMAEKKGLSLGVRKLQTGGQPERRKHRHQGG